MSTRQRATPMGPWTRGINNIDMAGADTFQPQRRPQDPTPNLVAAENVDIMRSGSIVRRQGRIKRSVLTNGHSVTSIDGRLFLVDDGNLKEFNADTFYSRILVGGLGNDETTFFSVAGEIFFINKNIKGRIKRNSVSFWGLETPVSTLSACPGGMPAGNYMVCITVESGGVESGARAAGLIELKDNESIVISVTNIDPNADSINVYCTDVNQPLLLWQKSVEASNQTILLEAVGQSNDPATTIGMGPPPAGQAAAPFRGHILVADGNTLRWSQPLAFHLFKTSSDAQLFPSHILFIAVQRDGFYVGLADSTFWVGGDTPDEWSVVEVSRTKNDIVRPIYVPLNEFPTLNADGMAPMWSSEKGFVVGMPGGTLRLLTDASVAMGAHSRASMAYSERESIRQVVMSLAGGEKASTYGASDHFSVSVTRSGSQP